MLRTTITSAFLALSALSIGCTANVAGDGTGSDEADIKASAACSPTSPRSHAIKLAVLPEAGQAPFVDSLTTATKSIRLMVYMLGTDEVFETLKTKAQAGVDVRVILDGGAQRTFNTPAFKGLTAAGVKVQWSNPKFSFMHAKTFVVDDRETVISTGNYPAKLIADERNYVATDTDLADAATVAKIFDADWTNVDPDITCTRLVVSPVNSKERILNVIESATTSLHIESLELADSDVIDSIVAQKKAGRDVQVVLADPTWSSGSDNAATAKKLLAEEIPVRWIPKATMLVHVKSILVDGKRAYMGSENLTSTSLEKNREIGLVVTDATPLKTMETTFAGDFASARPF